MVRQSQKVLTRLVRAVCLLGLLWTASFILPGALAAQADGGMPGQDQFAPLVFGDFFSCEVPANWLSGGSYYGEPSGDKKIYGITLDGPWRGELPVRISINYFAEDNQLYKSIEHYLRLFSQPALGVALAGDSYGPVTLITISGRSAKAFERIKNEYLPLNNLVEPVIDDGRVYERMEMMARPVPAKERFVVFPAEAGFYALRYSAPLEGFAEFLPDFERIVGTFKALR